MRWARGTSQSTSLSSTCSIEEFNMSSSEVILITGANTGLGLEIVKALCNSPKPYTILVGCRTASKGETAIDEAKKLYPSTKSTLSVIEINLASDQSIEQALDTITSTHGRIDALINNGGAQFDQEISADKMSIRAAWNASWDINVSGTQVLTTLAVPLLLKSSNARLIFMTSGTSTLTETESTANEMLQRLNGSPPAGWPKSAGNLQGYRSAKCGLNMMMREWTRILRNDGVKVWSVSPGFLATGLGAVGSEKLKQVCTPKIGVAAS